MKTAKILLFLLGVGILLLSVKAIGGLGDVEAAIEGAALLDAPQIHPQNEGKLVIFYGAPETIAPVYDEELALTIDAVKAVRYKEVYQLTQKKDGESTWEWTSTGSRSLLGRACVGEFELSAEILTALPVDADYDEFDPQESARYHLTTPAYGAQVTYVLPEGAYYYRDETVNLHEGNRLQREANREAAAVREGTQAYRYRVFDASKYPQMTFIGRQVGGMLHDSGIDGVTRVETGAKTREELIQSNKTYLIMGASFGMLCGAALMLLALRIGKNRHADGSSATGRCK